MPQWVVPSLPWGTEGHRVPRKLTLTTKELGLCWAGQSDLPSCSSCHGSSSMLGSRLSPACFCHLFLVPFFWLELVLWPWPCSQPLRGPPAQRKTQKWQLYSGLISDSSALKGKKLLPCHNYWWEGAGFAELDGGRRVDIMATKLDLVNKANWFKWK